MTLGDAWGREPEPTADDSSPVSMEYLRAKALEFQAVLNALDRSYTAATTALNSGALSMESQDLIASWVADYLEKRDQFRTTAQRINLAAEAVNAVGGRFPVLSIPRNLGAIPVVGLAAVIGAAALAISVAVQAVAALNDRLRRAQLIDAATPEQRARLLDAMGQSDAAVTESQTGTLAAIAPMVKWAAIAAIAFVAWRAWQGRR